MPQSSSFELRPMGIGDILDTAIRLYRARFVPFLTISLLVYVPYIALMLLLRYAVAGAPHYVQTAFGPRAVASPSAQLVGLLGRLLVPIVVLPLVQGALTYNISAEFLGESISAGASYRRAARRLLPMLGTQIAAGFVITLGYLLLIVPGVIFSIWYMIVQPIVLLETLSGSRAMSRSHELMKGNLGKGFLLAVVVGLVYGFVVFGGAALLGAIGLARNEVVLQTLTDLATALVLPFQIGAPILLYYDLRIRKEAFDLQTLAASLPQTKAPV